LSAFGQLPNVLAVMLHCFESSIEARSQCYLNNRFKIFLDCFKVNSEIRFGVF